MCLNFYLYGVDMSFTTKRIHGKEYEYFEFYLGKRKRSVLLGVKGGLIDKRAKRIVLIVLKAKIFGLFRKLWNFYSRCEEKGKSKQICECSYHGYVDVDELKTIKQKFKDLDRRLKNFEISELSRPIMSEINEIKRLIWKITAKRQTKPTLPLITVVYRDKRGYRQIKDVCVTCLYRRLWNYGVIGYDREPKKLGILFLNDDIQFSF